MSRRRWITPAALSAFAFARAIGCVGLVPCRGKFPMVGGYDQFWSALPAGFLGDWLTWCGKPDRPGPDAWARLGESVVTSSGTDRPSPRIVVVDVETRDPALVEPLLDMYGRTPLVVQTRRGAHYYFREPEGVTVKSNVFKALSHDVKARKSLCHLPGSAFQGGRYEAFLDGLLLDAATLLAEPEGCLLDVLPEFNLDALEDCATECGFRSVAWRRCDGVEHVLDADEARERGAAYLRASGPAVQDDGGHLHTRGVLLRIGDIGVSEEVALELALEWDESNQPRWYEAAIRRHVRDAYASRENAVGWKNADGEPESYAADDEYDDALAWLRVGV